MEEPSIGHMIKVVEGYILSKKSISVKISPPRSMKQSLMLNYAYRVSIGLIIIPTK